MAAWPPAARPPSPSSAWSRPALLSNLIASRSGMLLRVVIIKLLVTQRVGGALPCGSVPAARDSVPSERDSVPFCPEVTNERLDDDPPVSEPADPRDRVPRMTGVTV